jgi:hypothetical protein
MKTGLLTYLSDAIARVEAGGVASPSGSWLAGMFGKAANLFEKEVSHYVAGLLNACDLTYPADLGPAVKGTPPYDKLTLGQLAAVIREAGKRQPRLAAKHIPGGRIPRFGDEILTVNATWVATKHGEEIAGTMLVARMKTMLKLARLLQRTNGRGYNTEHHD